MRETGPELGIFMSVTINPESYILISTVGTFEFNEESSQSLDFLSAIFLFSHWLNAKKRIKMVLLIGC